jgi:hypothetical protein
VRLSVGKPLSDEARRSLGGSDGAVTLAVPIEVSGLPPDAIARLSLMALDIRGSAGDRYSAEWYSRTAPFRKIQVEARLAPWDRTPDWMGLTIDRAVYERLRTSPVTLKGAIRFDFCRRGSPTGVAVGAQADVAGFGKCSSAVQGQSYGFGTMLKVDCESPDILPTYTTVTLANPDTGEEWNARLGGATIVVSYPALTWLSPLYHRDAPFQLTESNAARMPGGRWMIPQAALATAKLAVTPEFPTGGTLVRFEFPNIQLSEYLLPPRR